MQSKTKKRTQKRKCKSKKKGESKAEDETDEETSDDCEAAPPTKRTKPEKGKKAAVAPHPKDKRVLTYVGTMPASPRHYGHSTIYNDKTKKAWRLKLFTGDKHEQYFKYSTNSKDAWDKLTRKILNVNK